MENIKILEDVQKFARGLSSYLEFPKNVEFAIVLENDDYTKLMNELNQFAYGQTNPDMKFNTFTTYGYTFHVQNSGYKRRHLSSMEIKEQLMAVFPRRHYGERTAKDE